MWEWYVITPCETERQHRLRVSDWMRLFEDKRLTRKTPSSICSHLPLILQPPSMFKTYLQPKDSPCQRIFSLHVGWIFHDSCQDKYPGILFTATCTTNMLCDLKVVRLGQGHLSLRQEQVITWLLKQFWNRILQGWLPSWHNNVQWPRSPCLPWS